MTKKWMLVLSKALCVFFAILFGGVIWGTQLAMNNAPNVTSFLGQTSYVYESNDEETVDPIKDVGKENYPWYYKPAHSSLAELKKDTDRVCEEIEEEGAVLLYNKTGSYDGNSTALPLKKGSKVSFFSTGSIRPHLAGQGSHGVSTYTKNDTYLKAFAEAGYVVNETLWNSYLDMHGDPSSTSADRNNPYRRDRQSYPNGNRPYKLGDIFWDDIYTNNSAEVKTSIDGSDAAIFCVTRQGGEGVDMWPGEFASSQTAQGNDNVDMLKLTKKEKSVLKGLTQLKKDGKIKRIIINLNLSNQMGMEFVNDPDIDVDAVVWTGGMGERGIYAVPKLLNGTSNFSGTLPFTVYYDNWDNPATANIYNGTQGEGNFNSLMLHYTNLSDLGRAKEEHTTSYVVYKEGIYVDYRYCETRYEDVVLKRANVGDFDYNKTIAYTHGTSLSYTDFELSDMRVERIQGGNDYKVSVTVKNTGSVAGKKAVQIYAQKPYETYDVENEIEKSSVDFVGFKKTGELAAGASETVEIIVGGREFMAAYDSNGAGTYVVTPGTYYLAAGNNAHDALNNILATKGKTTSDGMDYNGKKALAWSTVINKLDTTTYAFSDATGVKIKNLFDESDINKYSGRGNNHVTYTTRNNWKDTLSFFEPNTECYEKLEATAQLFDDQNVGREATEAEKSDRAYPEYERNYNENPLVGENGEIILDKNLTLIDLLKDENGNEIPLSDPRWDYLMNQMSWDEMAKLVRRGFRHTEPATSIAMPQSFNYNESNGIALSTWDRNDGGGNALGGSIPGKALAVTLNDPDVKGMAMLWPTNCVITATLNPELAEEAGKLWGEEGNWAGMSGLYGPGFNTYRTAYGGRNYEYFGADAYGAGKMGAYLIKGMQSQGMFAVIKHFAFNDAENYRRAASVWLTEQAAREIYLRQFYYPIVDGGALCVMSGMGRLGAVPCPSNESLMRGWLHGEAGLKGFATTDVMSGNYNSKVSQIKAGCDLSDDDKLTGQHDFAPYEPGKGYADFAWMMRDSAKHICYAVLHSNAMNGYTPNTVMRAVTPAWQYWIMAIDITVGLLLLASIGLLTAVLVLRYKNKVSE